MMLSATAEKALDAYGGESLWKSAKKIEAEVSTTGLLFAMKMRPVFDHVKIEMLVPEPISKISRIGKENNICGVLHGQDVQLEDENGNILEERKNARNYFPFGRRLFRWDDLDMSYFANYAFWNYFTFPRLLLRKDILWTEIQPGILDAEFPENFPTHSKRQRFFFDSKTGLLTQHNYNADIITSLATAANVVKSHQNFHGINLPAHRIVTPRKKNGEARNSPTLVEIIVHDLKITS